MPCRDAEDAEGEDKEEQGGSDMPGYDRTGPEGFGPMTGGRRGLCTGAFRAYGGYRRRGFFRGPGFGWRRAQQSFIDYPADLRKEDLQEQYNLLQTELQAVKQQLDELPAQPKEES